MARLIAARLNTSGRNKESKMVTIKELKDMLIEERVRYICNSIPDGNCPNAYYHFEYETGCMSEDENDNSFIVPSLTFLLNTF